MQRGEIRWYTFKKPDKRRPVLILTRDSTIEYLGEVTVAPMTTTIRHIPTEVVLTEDDGMPQMCCINLDHLQTVSKAHVGALITTLDEDQLLQVREALLFALGFDPY
jgi:mRNA interferase MazF